MFSLINYRLFDLEIYSCVSSLNIWKSGRAVQECDGVAFLMKTSMHSTIPTRLADFFTGYDLLSFMDGDEYMNAVRDTFCVSTENYPPTYYPIKLRKSFIKEDIPAIIKGLLSKFSNYF